MRYFALFLLTIALFACRNSNYNSHVVRKPGKTEMEDLNIFLIRKEREKIQNYIERKNLKMIESPTGLWFQILKEGNGELFSDNSKVRFEFECSLLDGTKCYSSEKSGPKELVLGKSVMEKGLNEGLRMLKPLSEAIFILPPFLAYGFTGDGKKIPSRAIIVYNVNILSPE